MTKKHGRGQGELIPRSKRPTIPIESSHQLVVLTEELNWDELLDLAEEIRSAKVKNNAGRPPHLRALVGRCSSRPPETSPSVRQKTSFDTTHRRATCVV